MKTILSLITIAIALSSCSKLDDITPDRTQPLYDKQEVHVYYDSAVYNIVVNGVFKEGGNMQMQGVDVYRIDSLSNLNFNLVMGKRTSVTVKGGIHYGYVNRIYNGMKFEWYGEIIDVVKMNSEDWKTESVKICLNDKK